MKVAVFGGTGVLGKPLVAALAARGEDVLALSRHAPRKLPEGASHRRIDLTEADDGLAEALDGIEVVVDASNSKSQRNAAPVLVDGCKRLLQAGAAADVRHHVGISIVGCDRVPIPYYKVKVEQERAIAAAELPWTLLRATQFHDLLAWAFSRAGRVGLVPTGAARLQPVEVTVVVEHIVELVGGPPGGRVADLAGPRVETLSELAHAWRRAGHRGLSLRIPSLGRIGRPVSEGVLCDPGAAAGGATFEEWLARG
jgi:uncharacterized protein YbjT (DUF2867 family)